MTTEVTYPHVEESGGQPARLKRISRIRVAQIVMDYLTHGWSPEEICRQYPHLHLAEVHSAMSYYYDHQDEIDAEIAAEVRQVEQDRVSRPLPPGVVKLKDRGLLKAESAMPLALYFDVHVPKSITEQLRSWRQTGSIKATSFRVLSLVISRVARLASTCKTWN